MALAVLGVASEDARAQQCGPNLGFALVPPGPFALGDLPQPSTVNLIIAADGTSDDMVVSDAFVGLACANNGDIVPCPVNDDAAGGAFSPIQYTGAAAIPLAGDCAGSTANVVNNGRTLQINFVPSLTFPSGAGELCLVPLQMALLDIGTDASPFALTGAAEFLGVCPQLSATASGSYLYQIDAACEAELDKQVSCDGGVTWFDTQLDFAGVGAFDDPNGDLTQSTACIGWNENVEAGIEAEPIMVRWLARNTGDLDLTCEGDFMAIPQGLADTNPELLPGLVQTNIPVNGGTVVEIDMVSPLCSDTLDDAEPNTATLNCFCELTGEEAVDPDTLTTPMDTAVFECQTPALGASKICEAQDDEGNNAIEISYDDNAGDATLENCTLTDTVWSLACDGDMPDAAASVVEIVAMDMPVAPPDNMVNLQATTLNDVDCEGNTCCNIVQVTCDIAGSGGKQINAVAADNCEILEDDCYTRTPGRWGTHPDDQDFVYDNFGPVESCGVDLDTSMAGVEGSGTEDICSIGGGQKTGVSNTQRQLERQCAAANLNLAASELLELSCEAAFPGITDLVEDCCNAPDSVCITGMDNGFTMGECIDMIDVFNNMMFDEGDDENIVDGPAEPLECRIAKHNAFLNGAGVRPH